MAHEIETNILPYLPSAAVEMPKLRGLLARDFPGASTFVTSDQLQLRVSINGDAARLRDLIAGLCSAGYLD